MEAAAIVHPDRAERSLMIRPLIAQHLPEIQALCREFGVTKLEAFTMPHSTGLDLLVTFSKDDTASGMRRLVELEERLATTLGRDVNLITVAALRNDWLRETTWQTRSTLYETPPRYPYAS
jgi:predicted nucleotidyltransferase